MRTYLLDILKKHPKAIINAFMMLSVGFTFFVAGMGSAHAIDLNDIPSDIRTAMTNYDQACHPPGSSATIYQQSDQWVYYGTDESDDGSTLPIPLSSGQTVPLHIYGIEFLCHPAINPSNANDVYDGGTTDAADSSVYTTGGSISDPLERAQTIWLTTQVNRAWGTPSVTAINVATNNSAPAGKINGGVSGSMQTIPDNLSTRYWTPSSPAPSISYTAPTVTKTTELEVTLNLRTYPANWFDEEGNNTYQCEIQPYQSVGSQANFNSATYLSNNCTFAGISIDFTINVSPPSQTCTPTPSCPCGVSTCTPPPPPPTTTPPCPNQPSESTAPTITLPQGNAPPQTTSSAAPGGTTTSPQPTWYQEQPTGEYQINYAGDQYGTTIGWTPTGYNNNPFTLNYTNYINDHPYDPHSTNVQYTEEYTQTVYNTQFAYYECPAQWTDYGDQCEFISEYPAAAACPAQWTNEGDGQCEFTAIYSAPKSCNSKGKDCVYGPCDAGFFLSGTQCYDYEYIASTPPCGAGYADYGSECIAYWWINATPVYDWVYSGGPSTVVGQNTEYYSAPQLGECYARTFSLAPTGTSVTVTSSNFSDLPTTVNVHGSVNATFGLDGPGGTPVAACEVNNVTTTIAAYYTTPGDPNPEPLPGGSQTTSGPYGQSSGCNSGSSTPVSATFYTSIPPLAYGDTVCAYVSVTPDGDYMDYTGQITDENGTPDPYGNGQTSINPGDAPYSFTDCYSPEAAEPYFKSFGGDVSSGLDSDYISGCYDNSAGIASWNQGGTSSTGAGTTAAALASGGISGFASGQNILSMISPSSLTFANYPSGTGNYGEGGNCGGEDYYALAESIPGAVSCPSSGVIDSATLAQQGVTFVNPLSPTINLGQNDRYICYSTSNVTIASNITYSPPPANTQPNNLPVFEVIVKGANIYIDTPFNQAYDIPDPGQPVTQLFGNYVAEISNGQGGTIDDTGPGGNVDVCAYNAPGAEDDYNNYCAQDRLVIDGSLTANQVDLYRSYGTLHNASSASTYSSSGGDPNDAEEFDFGPINWLTPGNDKLIIQSITSLPPVL